MLYPCVLSLVSRGNALVELFSEPGELGKGNPLLLEICDARNALLGVLDHLAEKECEGSFGDLRSLGPVEVSVID